MTGGVRSLLDALLALLALTDLERETWVDVHMVELSQVEIAKRDGVTQAAVSLRLRNAESKLKRAGTPTRVAA